MNVNDSIVSDKERVHVSVVMITFNAAKIIKLALESVKWADEVVIIDSDSKDDTKKIAESYSNVKFIIDKSKGCHGAWKKMGVDAAKNNWVLQLDCDEEVTPELRKDIGDIVSGKVKGHVGYFIPRKNFFYGRWLKHGGHYPDYQLRLFLKGKASFSDKDVVDERCHILDGSKPGYLVSAMNHYTQNSVLEHIRQINRVTSLNARGRLDAGQKVTLLNMPYLFVGRPLFFFCFEYFWKRGFLDGVHGFIVTGISGIFFFVVACKMWEMSKNHLSHDNIYRVEY